jgi:hypothetical protein
MRASSLDKLKLGGPCDAPLDTPATGGSNLGTLDTRYFKSWSLVTLAARGFAVDAAGCREDKIGSFEAVVWVTDSAEPESLKFDTALMARLFKAGHIKGRGAVYDYGAGRVVCAGPLDVSNSESVSYKGDWMGDPKFGDQSLERDLAAQLRRAIKTQLKTVMRD